MLKEEDGLCGGCGLLIKDRFYVLAVDKQWHNDCLKCTSCGLLLYNQITCFSKDGHIYCKEDYYRLNYFIIIMTITIIMHIYAKYNLLSSVQFIIIITTGLA